MNKIEYGNLYKFFVSFGMIFLFFPALGAFFLMNLDPPLITQDQMISLSDYSTNFIERKKHIFDFCFAHFSVFSIVSFCLGSLFTFFGIFKWWKNQSKEDAILAAEQTKHQAEANQLTFPELLQKANEKSNESGDAPINENAVISEPTSNSEEESTPAYTKVQSMTKAHRTNMDRVIRYFEVVGSCINRIKHQNNAFLSNHFFVQNVQIGKYDYDAIAISKNNNIDMIYEIKYWKKTPSSELLKNIFDKIKSSVDNYKAYQNRDAVISIFIITPKEDSAINKEQIAKYFRKLEKKCPASLDFINEEILFNQGFN